MIPVINMRETGKRIEQLRIEKGYSVKDIQDVFGFGTPQAVYKWQQGRTLPSIDNLLVLSELFGVHMEEILVTDDTYMASA